MSAASRSLSLSALAALGLTLGAACETRAPRDAPARTATANAAPFAPTPSAEPPLSASMPHPVTPSAEPPLTAPMPHPVAPSASSSSAPAPGPSTPRAPCHVALIGDSLTDARAHGGGYVRFLEERSPASRFDNFAKGGAMVNQMRRKFEASVLTTPAGTYSHVVVFGGVNDLYSDETAGRTNDKIERDLGAIYAGAKAHGARVVALTVAPWGGFTKYYSPHRAQTTRELGAWILAQRANGAVDVAIDAFTLLACGDADRICPRYETARSDGLHFGKAGHQVLGQALYDAEFSACP